MPERKLDIVLGVKGAAQASKELSGFSDRLRALRDTSMIRGMDDLGKLVSGAGFLGAFAILERSLTRISEAIGTIGDKTKEWRAVTIDMLKSTPVLGGLGKMIASPMEAVERRENALRDMEMKRVSKDMTPSIREEIKAARRDKSGMSELERMRQEFAEKEKALLEREADMLKAVTEGRLSGRLFDEWKKSQWDLLKKQRGPLDQMEKEKSWLANNFFSRAGGRAMESLREFGGDLLSRALLPQERQRMEMAKEAEERSQRQIELSRELRQAQKAEFEEAARGGSEAAAVRLAQLEVEEKYIGQKRALEGILNDADATDVQRAQASNLLSKLRRRERNELELATSINQGSGVDRIAPTIESRFLSGAAQAAKENAEAAASLKDAAREQSAAARAFQEAADALKDTFGVGILN